VILKRIRDSLRVSAERPVMAVSLKGGGGADETEEGERENRYAAQEEADGSRYGRRATLRWVWFAFIPSSLLLGVTQYISTDIAVIPLFWVIPLALYLLTFVLVFARRTLLSRDLVLRLFPGALVTLIFLLLIQATSPVTLVYPVHLSLKLGP